MNLRSGLSNWMRKALVWLRNARGGARRRANLRLAALMLLTAGAAALIGAYTGRSEGIQSTLEAGRGNIAPQGELAGFSRAAPGRKLTFPQDFGAHPDYQTEWWYFTGNLADETGRRFGYQLTFFRRALLPPQARSPRASAWSAQQIYLAHFALTDEKANQHWSFERLARGAAGLAGAQASPFEVWLEDWSVRQTAPDRFQLNAAAQRTDGSWLRLSLELHDLKGPILQGKEGYSQKGPDSGNASYYYSRTRIAAEGQIEIGGQRYPVQGTSWMDHEFSTSALAPDQVGWDWFSIQLDDQTELMVFQIRKQDGTVDPFSSGAWIAADGTATALSNADFTIEVLAEWESPLSGGVYPARWRIRVPSLQLELTLSPLVADQEMDLSYRYWEGAVRIDGTRQGEPVAGYGYVELTGYAGSMAGEF